MDIIKEKVNHRQFGAGVVVGQSETAFTVKFCEAVGEKKFLYPAAFETFLTMENPQHSETIAAELLVLSGQQDAIRNQREEASQLRQEEKDRVLSEQKKAATKKRTPAKKTAPKKVPAKVTQLEASTDTTE